MTDFHEAIWKRIPTVGTKHHQEAKETVVRDGDGIPIDPDYSPKAIPEHCIRDYRLSSAGNKAKLTKAETQELRWTDKP